MEFNRKPLPTIINMVYDLSMKIILINGDSYNEFNQVGSFLEGNLIGIII
jgi:hypothetical protein